MSIARRKRLEALERRQPRARPWVDPFPSIERLWPDLEAVAKGRACWLKRPEAEWPEEAKDALDRAMAEVDTMHRRLATAVDHTA
jgi:hypothetical protein